MQDGENLDRNELAEDRTDWAEDRTVLANERTFAGWMRTGLGAVGVALGLKAVFGDFEPTWVAKTVATAFVATALLIFWAAQANARRTIARLKTHEAQPLPQRRLLVVTIALSVASVGVGCVLWLL